MFYHKTLRRLRADYESFPSLGGQSAFPEPEPAVRRSPRFVLRFAACASLALVVAVAGVVLPPSIPLPSFLRGAKTGSSAFVGSGSSQISHEFVLMARAAETSSSPSSAGQNSGLVTLKDNLLVQLPGGKFKYHKNNGSETDKNGKVTWTSGSDFSTDSFLCKGENLKTVNYSVQAGQLMYSSKQLRDRFQKEQQDAIICTITVPLSKLKGGDFEGFKRMWKNGDFQEYQDKYFGGKDVDLNKYSVGFSYGSGTGADGTQKITIQPIPTESTDPVLFRGGHITGKTVDTPASDTDGNICWQPSDEIWQQVQKIDNQITAGAQADYSSVPGDVITVTATFTDGQTAVKHIELSFSKDGSLCARQTD